MERKPNVKLLKKVRKLIAEEPRRLQMEHWGQQYTKKDVKKFSNLPPCGTTMCLGGHILFASGTPRLFKNRVMRAMFGRENVAERAARLIGIPVQDCPFNQIFWGKVEVLAWIDRQIDAASK